MSILLNSRGTLSADALRDAEKAQSIFNQIASGAQSKAGGLYPDELDLGRAPIELLDRIVAVNEFPDFGFGAEHWIVDESDLCFNFYPAGQAAEFDCVEVVFAVLHAVSLQIRDNLPDRAKNVRGEHFLHRSGSRRSLQSDPNIAGMDLLPITFYAARKYVGAWPEIVKYLVMETGQRLRNLRESLGRDAFKALASASDDYVAELARRPS